MAPLLRSFPALVGLGVLLVTFGAGCASLTEPPTPEPLAAPPPAPVAAPKPTAQPEAPAPTPQPTAAAAPPAPAPAPGSDKLVVVDEVVGKGRQAKAGDTVSMKYVGTLTDGKEFDSTKKHGDQPFTFPLGAGKVIKGWDEGVPGMKVGGKRKLTIPPSLGYGARGAGRDIPPNATLQFEVELVEIKP